MALLSRIYIHNIQIILPLEKIVILGYEIKTNSKVTQSLYKTANRNKENTIWNSK